MARPAARDDEDCVDADVVAGSGEADRQPLSGDRDAAQAITVEREGGGFLAAAGLDLDEGDYPAAPRDDVDFAAGDARSPGEDGPAMEPQPPRRDRLGAPPGLFGPRTVAGQPAARSSARA